MPAATQRAAVALVLRVRAVDRRDTEEVSNVLRRCCRYERGVEDSLTHSRVGRRRRANAERRQQQSSDGFVALKLIPRQ